MVLGPMGLVPPSHRFSREVALPPRTGPVSWDCEQPGVPLLGLRSLSVSLGQVLGSVQRTGPAALRSVFGEIVPGGATLA
jgi:hypothetical protein